MYTGNIRNIVITYRNNFSALSIGMHCKRQCVQTFQSNWDVCAADFSEMFRKAFPKKILQNYIDDSWNQPLQQMCRMVEFDPEAVRRIFLDLYQENLDISKSGFTETVVSFISASQSLYAKCRPGERCDQNERSALFFLAFRFPEKYTLFKPSTFERLYKAANVNLYCPPELPPLAKAQLYMRLIELIRYEIVRDPELVRLAQESASECEYDDPSHMILAEDIACNLKNEQIFKDVQFPASTRLRFRLTREPYRLHCLQAEFGEPSEGEKQLMNTALMIICEGEQALVNRAGVDAAVIPDCIYKGDDIGYSIRSASEAGRTKYILVKASESGIDSVFRFLPEEIEFSERHADQFQLYILSCLDTSSEIITAQVTSFTGSLQALTARDEKQSAHLAG